MGMPCEVNSILKLSSEQFPAVLELMKIHQVQKDGYRILPMDVPLQLVDENWLAHGEVVLSKLIWQNQQTELEFTINRIYDEPQKLKS
jgi:hypothetical protein